MSIVCLIFISLVILWNYCKVSTRAEILQMVEVFLKEYNRYEKYFSQKDQIVKTDIFKFDDEVVIDISPKIKMRFSSYKNMRKQFREKGGILLNLLEFVEMSDSEEYKQLEKTLVQIRQSVLYCGELL